MNTHTPSDVGWRALLILSHDERTKSVAATAAVAPVMVQSIAKFHPKWAICDVTSIISKASQRCNKADPENVLLGVSEQYGVAAVRRWR